MWRMLIGDFPIPGTVDNANSLQDANYRRNVRRLPADWLEGLEDVAENLSEHGMVSLSLSS